MRLLYNKFRLIYRLLNYVTFSRVINFIGLQFAYFFSRFGVQKLGAFSPFFISVETANYCNLHCPECPVGQRTTVREDARLFQFALFQKLIDEQKKTLFHVILYFQGEPLINKKLPDFIDYAHKAGVYTSISTNAQLLNKKNAKELVEAGLDKIIISLDGTTQEVYEQYRIGGKLQKALDGIEALNAAKRDLNSPTPMIEMQFIVLKSNENQMDEMKVLAKKLQVDRLVFKTAQLYDFENGHPLLTTKDKYARYKYLPDGKLQIKNKLPNHCWRLWNGAVVNAFGEVLPCCYDKGSDYGYGAIDQQTFLSAWHSESGSDFRDSVLLNRKQYEMCRNCTGK